MLVRAVQFSTSIPIPVVTSDFDVRVRIKVVARVRTDKTPRQMLTFIQTLETTYRDRLTSTLPTWIKQVRLSTKFKTSGLGSGGEIEVFPKITIFGKSDQAKGFILNELDRYVLWLETQLVADLNSELDTIVISVEPKRLIRS